MWPLVGLGALDLSSLTLVKSYSEGGENPPWKLALACLLYGLVPLVMVSALRTAGVGNTNLAWNVVSTLMVYTIAVAYFKESVTGNQCLGIILAVGGLYLITLDEK
jgi:drug/metabolite transporter (DMT)-like permease